MKDWRRYVILGLALVVAWLLLFRKPAGVTRIEQENADLKEYIRAKESEAVDLQHQAAEFYQKLEQDSVDKVETRKQFDRQLSAAWKEVDITRKIAAPIIARNDTVRNLVAALDSVNALQARRIDQLVQQDRISSLINRDLLSVQVKELGVVSEVVTAQAKVIKNQEKIIRRLKAGKVVRNVVIGVAAVGGFLLGASQ